MKVTITLSDHKEEMHSSVLVFGDNVIDVGPAGSFFRVVETLEEQTTASGLVASVAGGKRHTWIPASTIRKVEVVE